MTIGQQLAETAHALGRLWYLRQVRQYWAGKEIKMSGNETKHDDSGFVTPKLLRELDPNNGDVVRDYECTDGMSLRQYAAIHLRQPDSGLGWLDEMIARAKRDDVVSTTAGEIAATQETDHAQTE